MPRLPCGAFERAASSYNAKHFHGPKLAPREILARRKGGRRGVVGLKQMLLPDPSAPHPLEDSVRAPAVRRLPRPMDFLRWNREIALRIERSLLKGYSIETTYRNAIHQSLGAGSLVLDLGGGARCIHAGPNLRIVGADILFADLAGNRDIQAAVVSDLDRDFPFRPESFDAVTACYFVEHVRDTRKLIRNIAAVLRPGGKLFLLFPCRYAPFAIVNRVIPNRLTNWLLRRILDESHGGFPASYDNCWPKRMREILDCNGLDTIDCEVCFYQSHYYAGFLPLYALSLAYDFSLKKLNLPSLAASACFVAEKRGR
jgi:SAM-dependent methyltransferase